MQPFGIDCPTRIRFGAGVYKELAGALPSGCRRVALVRGRSAAADPVAHLLAKAGIEVITITVMGEPSVASVNAAYAACANPLPDAVLACGGGSVVDLGKALTFVVSDGAALTDTFDTLSPERLAKARSVPCIAVPTTAGTGAEVTANAVLDVPSRGAKISLRGAGIAPDYAFVDPELMRGAPRSVVLQSGLDALCQVIEAYISSRATPFTDALSLPAIGTGLRALPAVLARDALDDWTDMAWVSLASGLALANGGLGAAHGLASVVGGRFDAPHGGLCGRFLLPTLRATLEYAAPGTLAHARTQATADLIAQAFAPRCGDALSGFGVWMEDAGLPRLADWGVTEASHADIAAAAPAASSSQKGAVPLPPEAFAQMLRDAQ